MASDIEKAAQLLRAGELVAFPTETVYGLGANALDPVAVAQIYEAKGRPPTSPLIVHVSSVEMARQLAAEWPPAADLLARRFWPGPLTLIVRKNPIIPDVVTAGLDSVGLRLPAHPLAQELLRLAAIPVAAPSANRFTELSPTTAAHVREALGDRVACVLDGGQCDVGIESTVLSLATQPPTLLRPGMVTAEAIEAVIGPVRRGSATAPGEAHASPGLHEKHYSPRTPLRLVRNAELPPGRGMYLWIRQPGPADAPAVRMPETASGYAIALYDTLHRLDRESTWEWIAAEEPPASPAWDGIRDRLRRAAQR